MQITFQLMVKQLMSFDPCEWTENLMKEYMLVIDGFFTLPLPLLSATYRRAIQVQSCPDNRFYYAEVLRYGYVLNV